MHISYEDCMLHFVSLYFYLYLFFYLFSTLSSMWAINNGLQPKKNWYQFRYQLSKRGEIPIKERYCAHSKQSCSEETLIRTLRRVRGTTTSARRRRTVPEEQETAGWVQIVVFRFKKLTSIFLNKNSKKARYYWPLRCPNCSAFWKPRKDRSYGKQNKPVPLSNQHFPKK